MSKSDQIRSCIAQEAARLMYEEGVKQYFDAKRIAARHVVGKRGGRRLRFRPGDLPSNGEIRDALLDLSELLEGERRSHRLFAMRVVALEAMYALPKFWPRLIGSVSTGHVRRGSDIDLHVFSDDLMELERHLHALGWVYEREVVSIRTSQGFRDYVHLLVDEIFPLELSVYSLAERKVRGRSSTDGKVIERIKPVALLRLLEEEHAEAWRSYQQTGEVEHLDMVLDDQGPLTMADLPPP